MISVADLMLEKIRAYANLPFEKKELPLKVLIVDDDPNWCSFMQEKLTARGCDVETATSGETAVRIVEKTRPIDRILLDLSFPIGMQGDEVLRAIRQIAPMVAVTIVSGNISPELYGLADKIHCTLIEKNMPLDQIDKAIDSILVSP